MKKSSLKLAYLGIFTALSLVCFLVEELLPPLIIPGAKIGLGNIFVMLALVLFSFPDALVMLAAKCILSAIFGGVTAIVYSAAAGVVSLSITCLFVRFFSERISLTATAVFSATVHNLTQLATFAIVTRSKEVFVYAPYLALAGAAAGVVTGLAAYFILRYFPFGGEKTARTKGENNRWQ